MAHGGTRRQHWWREFLTATFMAALLVVLHHRLPVIDVLDKFAFLFVSANSVQSAPTEPAAVVIGIDQKTFERDFFEQSPLNRCAMAEKLAAIYAARPALLVIDFDLSPSLAGVMPNAPDRNREQDCEARLYASLQANAAATRTVLLEPFEVATEAARDAKQEWRKVLSKQGISFGSGALPVQFGFVQQQYAHTDTLAAVATAASATSAANRNTAPAPAANIRAVSLQPTEHGEDRPLSESAHLSTTLLNFRAFASEVQSLSWDQWRSGAPALPLAGKAVFFGAAYGADDRFLTPIDELYGVALHAAAFVSLHNPISATNAGVAFAIDVVIGMIFGAMVALAWDGYLHAKLSRTAAHQGRRAFAFLYLWALALAYVIALWMLMQVAVHLVATRNVWISPLPMALGMTIDAFIMGAIHALEHAIAPHPAARDAHPNSIPVALPVRLVRGLKAVTWIGVGAYAVLLTAGH